MNKAKILKTVMKLFQEKGFDTDEIEEIAENSKKKRPKKMHQIEKITDLKDMLKKSGQLYAKRPAYKLKNNEGIKIITHKEFREDINGLGTQLSNIGLLEKKIAVISENRYDWAVAYLAICCGTGIVVPLDKALPANEIESLIVRSGVEAIIYSSKYNEIMQEIKNRRTTDLRYFISMDLNKNENGIYSQKEFIEKGKKLIKSGNKKFLNAKINNEDMCCMLFTSGTTAMSKAVMLSHKNICTNLMDIASVLEVNCEDTLLSFLPLHHTFECTTGFLYPMYKGASIVYCEGIRHIAENIKEYKITAMISVPILYENIYKKIIKSIEKKGKLGEVEKIIKLSNMLLKIGVDVRKKVFKEIHESVGENLRLLISGAAALEPSVEKGFNDLGFKTAQGYGLTETSPVIAAGNDFETQIGSVGKVMPSLKTKIIDKNEKGIGEIIVKGPSVMIGYYQNEEATKEVFEKGWFKTGDLGYFDKKGFLHITGRRKNVIILKNGKNIYPEEIESVINRIDGIKESFVYGKPEENDENDYKLCAKVVYDRDMIKEIYEIETEEDILKQIWIKIKEINKTMPAYKYIKEITITEQELVKTTTQKIKRHEELAKINCQ